MSADVDPGDGGHRPPAACADGHRGGPPPRRIFRRQLRQRRCPDPTKEIIMSKNVETLAQLSTEAGARELGVEELDLVSGGLNPQPLPPGGFVFYAPYVSYQLSARSLFRF